jgi:hypothetical protein
MVLAELWRYGFVMTGDVSREKPVCVGVARQDLC